MLIDLYPRAHARFTSLPLLGPHLEGFAGWLAGRDYPRTLIRERMRKTPLLEELLQRSGCRKLPEITESQLRDLAPRDSQDNICLSALVRGLADYLRECGTLATPVATPSERLVEFYREFLAEVRGFADSTVAEHRATATELLSFLRYDKTPTALRGLDAPQIEAFLKSIAKRMSRASLQHVAAHLRSFLRFLADRGEAATGLDGAVDTPRLYRSETLPLAWPWDTVQEFLESIDRTTPMGRRDYAMFLLVSTYGLRSSETVQLTLDHIAWRAGQFRIERAKTRTATHLPLTEEAGAALLDYLRHDRPLSRHREVFLRVREPRRPLLPASVGDAFHNWVRRSSLQVPRCGPHCLRHSAAMHLLRQGTPLKTIGDLLGHRSPESTCSYLRLHTDDLRDAALDLPSGMEARR